MSLIFDRPQSAGELLDVSLNIVKRHATLFLTLGIWPLVALTAIDLGFRLLPYDSDLQPLAIPLSFAVYAVAEARVSLAAWQVLHRQEVNVSLVRSTVRRRLGSVILGYTAKWLAILLGLLLVLPGVLLALRWFAVPAVNVVEDLGVRDGFRRSGTLARGNRRQILLTLGLLDVGLTLGSLAFAMTYMDEATGHPPLWVSFAGWAFSLIYLPYHGVLSSALYANARVRNEAHDVEERLLSPAGAA